MIQYHNIVIANISLFSEIVLEEIYLFITINSIRSVSHCNWKLQKTIITYAMGEIYPFLCENSYKAYYSDIGEEGDVEEL